MSRLGKLTGTVCFLCAVAGVGTAAVGTVFQLPVVPYGYIATCLVAVAVLIGVAAVVVAIWSD